MPRAGCVKVPSVASPRVLVAGKDPLAHVLARDIRASDGDLQVVEATPGPAIERGDDNRDRTDARDVGFDVVVTAFDEADRLREFLLGANGFGNVGRDLVALDFGLANPLATREVAHACRSAGVTLLGARRVCWHQNGVRRSLLYVDEAALRVPGVAPMLECLAERVVPVSDAKCVGMLTEILQGVSAVVVREALLIGRRAGVTAETLVSILRRGSGATAMLDDAALSNWNQKGVDAGAPGTDSASLRQGMAAGIAAAQSAGHPLFLGGVALALFKRPGDSTRFAAHAATLRATRQPRPVAL
jgi:2-hydroxy-3-oxopropionate reductase